MYRWILRPESRKARRQQSPITQLINGELRDRPSLSYMEMSAGPISLQEKAESEGGLHGKDCTDYQLLSSLPKAVSC